MRVSPPPFEVRELVSQTFGILGASDESLEDLDESILIQEGHGSFLPYRRSDGHVVG